MTDADASRNFIQSGVGTRLLKFGATWCAPCRRVAPEVHARRQRMNSNIRFLDVDIDEDMDVYTMLKSKRLVGGIPSIVLYAHGNINILSPDFVCTGSNSNDVSAIFKRAEIEQRQYEAFTENIDDVI